MPAEERVTTAQLCKILGLSDRVIAANRAEGMPYKLVKGKCLYDLAEVDQWRKANKLERDGAQGGRPPGLGTTSANDDVPLSILGVNAAMADLRTKIAKMGIEELNLERERGNVIGFADSIRLQQGLLIAFKRAMEFMPRRAAARAAGLTRTIEIQRSLEAECRDILKSIPDEAWALIEGLTVDAPAPIDAEVADDETTADTGEWSA